MGSSNKRRPAKVACRSHTLGRLASDKKHLLTDVLGLHSTVVFPGLRATLVYGPLALYFSTPCNNLFSYV